MITVKADRRSQQVFIRLGKLGHPSTHRRMFRHAWFKFAVDLKKEANEKILERPKGGEVYIIRVRGRTRRHRASAAGETHANMTGKLRRTLSWTVTGGGETMRFGYGLSRLEAPKYASFVEFGTSRMKERPSLMNAINATRRNAEQHFANAFRKEFSG